MRRFLTNPVCLVFGHDFVTKSGKTYCSFCGKVVR